MSATIFHPNGTNKQVQNLRWIIEHRHEVVALRLDPPGEKYAEDWAAEFTAVLADGRVYWCLWASLQLAREFLVSRRFNHIESKRDTTLEVKM